MKGELKVTPEARGALDLSGRESHEGRIERLLGAVEHWRLTVRIS